MVPSESEAMRLHIPKRPAFPPKTWRRRFALWPRYDSSSRVFYWLEHVWERYEWRDGYDGCYTTWEYRGGLFAPEIKQRPLGT